MIHRRHDVRLRARLQEAARPGAITEERVRAYCAERGIDHHRFEVALLQQALQVVTPAQVIDRILAGGGEPTFVQLERLLRLGRLSKPTRVHLLYWRRLRDWLRWNAGLPARGAGRERRQAG